MSERFDLVIIGSGTAAQVAASRVRAAGRSVAIVDEKPFGGTCALRGCDPKKLLLGGAEVSAAADRRRGIGIGGSAPIDWPALMRFKRDFTGSVPPRQMQRHHDRGIETFRGHARFVGQRRVRVGDVTLEASHVLIATGAQPRRLGILGEHLLAGSDDFLELDRLPARIILVGGGYVAAEAAHVAARAGAQVTILQHGPRLLKHFEPELVDWLMDAFAAAGISTRTGTTVEALESIDGGIRVHAQHNGRAESFDADLVVHSAGRVPAIADLGLDAAGVAVDGGRLRLNEFLQSETNPAVYAAGDAAAAGPPLTPVSSHDGRVVATNIVEGNQARPDYRGVPSVAFTIPPIAAVGLGEAEARRQGLRCRVRCERASDWFTARQAAQPVYGFKTLVDEGSDRIVGAHLVGPGADEVINLFALAIRQGLTARQLSDTMFAYPTGASDIGYMV